MASAATRAAENAAAVAEGNGYAAEHRPLRAYATLSGGFATAFAAALIAAKQRRGDLPERLGVWDVVTVGAATHKVSRLLAKDKVTSFLRAPFVRYEEGSGHGEVSEEPRGRGVRLAVGELLGCPYCLGQWVAAGFGVGMVGAPRFTRLVAFIYSAETVGDFLQLAYSASEKRASG